MQFYLSYYYKEPI